MPDALEIARKVRARRLAELTAVYTACACRWPISKLRNGHGHASGCPAVPIIEAQKAAHEEARALAEY